MAGGVLKTFIHCFVEREAFLFTATDLSFSISSFETTANLEMSAASSCWVVVAVVLVLIPVDSRQFGTAAINIYGKVSDHLTKTDIKSWKIICQ